MTRVFDNDQYKRHGCICHILNLLLGDLHEIFHEKLDNLSFLQSKIKNSNSFVRLCEKTNNSTKKVPSFTPTRWYSLFQTINCFNHSIDVIYCFLREQKIENPFSSDELMLKDCPSTLVNNSKFLIQYKKKIDDAIENLNDN